MLRSKPALFTLLALFILLSNLIIVANSAYVEKTIFSVEEQDCSDDFYFVQITDTHVMHKLFDRNEIYKSRLGVLIDKINCFEKKPAFIVITGDLVSVGGGIIGILNYRAFLECFYKKDEQLYADSEYTIPVYTIPGNHDYYLHSTLFNYHRFIDSKHVIRNSIMELLENRQLSDRFTITYENLTMFMLDSGHDRYILKGDEGVQIKGSGLSYWFDIEWLENKLNNCNSKHKIVLMHHPAINWGDQDTISRNRETFIQLCEGYNIELVLSGHTHATRVFDKDKNFFENSILPLNCSEYSTLHVQTDACKEGSYYRNITI
jgi:3',5'-cyclic AMP phosphodiesterase CpdA